LILTKALGPVRNAPLKYEVRTHQNTNRAKYN